MKRAKRYLSALVSRSRRVWTDMQPLTGSLWGEALHAMWWVLWRVLLVPIIAGLLVLLYVTGIIAGLCRWVKRRLRAR